MKKIRELPFIKKYFSQDLPVRHQLFNIIMVSGAAVGIVSFFITLFASLSLISMAGELTVSLFMGMMLYIGNKRGNYERAAVISSIVVTCVFFPLLYFSSGGVSSGMTIWFVFGLVYEFMLLETKQFYIVFPMSCLAVLISMGLSHHYPQFVTQFETENAMYLDNIQSIYLVSIALGLLLQFQFGIYVREREELQRRTNELEQALSDIRKVNFDKREFLANISNEIRSPLNVMLGMNEMIRRESKEQTSIEYATRVNTSGNLVLSLLNDVIDYNRIEAESYELIPESYYLSDLLNDVYATVVDRADQKGLEFILDIDEDMPQQCYGDEITLRKILVNLLTGAIRYTEHGKIFLKIKQQEQKDGMCKATFYVRDTGNGMTKEEVESITQAIHKAGLSNGASFEQTGLELELAHAYLQLMGSELALSSVFGEGTTFSFELVQRVVDKTPIGQFEPEEITYDSGVEEFSFRAPGARILIVDDNRLNHDVIKLLLQNFRVKVTTASSGAECLELIRGHKYHMILMDCMMREMDGLQTYERFCEQKENLSRDANIIAMTTGSESKTDEELIEFGFAGTITKPITGHMLEMLLKEYLPKELIKEREKVGSDSPFGLRKKGKGWISPEKVLLDYHVNVNHGMVYFAGMRTQYFEILQDFAEAIPKQIDELKALISTPSEYAISVHGLKANAKTIGADFLYQVAKEQEQKAIEGDERFLQTHIEALEAEALYVRKGILQYFENR